MHVFRRIIGITLNRVQLEGQQQKTPGLTTLLILREHQFISQNIVSRRINSEEFTRVRVKSLENGRGAIQASSIGFLSCFEEGRDSV